MTLKNDGRIGARWLPDSVLWLLIAALFSVWYLNMSSVLVNSFIAQHAHFQVEPPFLYRFLLPFVFGVVFPSEWLDLGVFRFFVAYAFAVTGLYLMPKFTERLLGDKLVEGDQSAVRWAFIGIMVAHYCLPRPFRVYYVYDVPAIAFYMLTFLTLTERNGQIGWKAAILTLLFSLNRETVLIAILHAFAFHAVSTQAPDWRVLLRKQWPVWARLTLIVAGVVLLRLLVSHELARSVMASVAPLEDGQIRIVANLNRIFHKGNHAAALLLIGFGCLIWLPWRFARLTPMVKFMFLASVPAVLFLWVVGNIVELRMYSELVPLLAVGLFLSFRRRQG